jgi:hypothetical protein
LAAAADDDKSAEVAAVEPRIIEADGDVEEEGEEAVLTLVFATAFVVANLSTVANKSWGFVVITGGFESVPRPDVSLLLKVNPLITRIPVPETPFPGPLLAIERVCDREPSKFWIMANGEHICPLAAACEVSTSDVIPSKVIDIKAPSPCRAPHINISFGALVSGPPVHS